MNNQQTANGVYVVITDPDGYINTATITTVSGPERLLTITPVQDASGNTATATIYVINTHGSNSYGYDIIVSAEGDATAFTANNALLFANNSTEISATAIDWDYPYSENSTLTLPTNGTPTGVSYMVGTPTISQNGAQADWVITVSADCTGTGTANGVHFLITGSARVPSVQVSQLPSWMTIWFLSQTSGRHLLLGCGLV